MKQTLTTRILKYLLIISIGLAATYALIWMGYSAAWTGFADYTKPSSDYVRGKTLWDWMQLFIIPIFLSIGVFLLNRAERNTEREIATDRQREATFQSYLDRMADLLLEKDLRSTENKEVREVARTLTLSTLRGLDEKRKGFLLRFIHEANLIHRTNSIIDLGGADLSHVHLGFLFSSQYIYNPLKLDTVRYSVLDVADLGDADLSRVILKEAELSFLQMKGVNLQHSDLRGANLYKANLRRADLRHANLMAANLSGVNLLDANLSDANLCGVNLQFADLKGADLSNVDLSHANLESADLEGTSLRGADLSNAKLKAAKVDYNEQLAMAISLKGATMPDGTKHDWP